MRSVARALGALVVTATVFLPYARPALCALRAAPQAQHTGGHEHGSHGSHAPAGHQQAASQVSAPDQGGTCHGTPSCGLTHVAPLRARTALDGSAPWSVAPTAEPAGGLSAVRSITPPPPRS